MILISMRKEHRSISNICTGSTSLLSVTFDVILYLLLLSCSTLRKLPRHGQCSITGIVCRIPYMSTWAHPLRTYPLPVNTRASRIMARFCSPACSFSVHKLAPILPTTCWVMYSPWWAKGKHYKFVLQLFILQGDRRAARSLLCPHTTQWGTIARSMGSQSTQ